MQWFLATLFVFGGVCSQASSQNTYTAYIPKHIRPGFEIAYTISVFNYENPIEVTSGISSEDNAFKKENVLVVEAGSSQRIVLGTVPLGYTGATKFMMNITGKDTVTDAVVFRNSSDDFMFATKAFSIFIQTDKAIYKPGHTIKFRAICLTPDLRPLKENVTYQVQDPNDNIVLLEHDVAPSHGVVGGEFPLNKDSIEGEWKIGYKVQGYLETLPVTVKVYKLPKFEVKLDIPSYIHPGMEGFTVKLSATYTFGKPVDGLAQIIISPRNNYYFGRPAFDLTSAEGKRQTLSYSSKEFDGTYEAFVPMKDVRDTLGWDGNYKTDIAVIGLVTEELTNIKFNDTQQIEAQPTNIKVETIFKLDTIKPGLPYTAYIEVSEFDGERLMDEDRRDNNLVVDLLYEYPSGYQFPEETTAPPEWRYSSRKETLLFDIPPNGIIEMRLDAKSDGFNILKMTPFTNKTERFGRYENRFEAKRAQSPSDTYLQVSTEDNSVSPGESASVNVKTTEPISTFGILVIGKGEILLNVTFSGSAGTDHDYSFPVTHSMVPDVQVLASYVRPDGEIVADYVQITVALSLEDQVTISSSASRVDAGTDVSISVKTNGPGSYVGARAIDQSVLLLKSGNDISEERIVRDLDRYSTSDDDTNDRDRWWWYYPRPSGAKDATEVFEKAGMICLTNAFLYSGPAIDTPGILYKEGPVFAMAENVQRVEVDTVSVPAISLRSYFPETWLWNEKLSGYKNHLDIISYLFYTIAWLTGPIQFDSNVVRLSGFDCMSVGTLAYCIGVMIQLSKHENFNGPVFAIDDQFVRKENTVNGVSVTQSSSVLSPSPRTFFPETWIWDDRMTGDDGVATFNTTAPDTITSWVVSAFSVSDQYGLGVADTHKITVFRNFFVSLNLPLRITRGEIIIVQAIVFNYFKTELDVTLTLGTSNDFELILTGDDASASGSTRRFTVPSDGAHSIKFPVRVISLGEVPVTVSAVSELAGDAITRKVFVRPEGIKQCYTTSTLFNRDSASAAPDTEELEIQFPVGIVSGSGKANLYVYGDILGSTINNLGRLLQTPGGCGEQNMISFAPDVFVTIYLKTANLLDAETQDLAYGHIRDGYSIELKYKHDDGSYSAFGGSDGTSGSTWLTAFVIKCFIHARALRPEFIESRIVDQGLDFLVSTQSSDGTFVENGKVSHKDMQGGVNSATTMTAYVLITLQETTYPAKKKNVVSAVNSARTYLENKLNEIKDDVYALSLVTYALQVSGSLKADEALAALELLATVRGGLKYWHKDSAGASSYSKRWAPPYYRPPTNDIEMTSYALLTYAKRNDVGNAAPVVKWLTSKQNELGGYSSTQDTVMAVQALASLATLLIGQPQNLDISVTHSVDEEFRESFTLDSTNSMVFNNLQVKPVNGLVEVTAEGQGTGVAQLSVCYNIPDEPFDNEPFDCETKVDSNDPNSARVEFCCSQKSTDKEPTGMFLFEIGMPNGFTVNLDSEKERNPKAQLVELGDETVNIYYNELSPGVSLCADVNLKRYADVAAVKPSPLVASDYYKPSKRVARMYAAERLADTGACELCGKDCPGCPGKGSAPGPHLHIGLFIITSSLTALLLRD